MRNKQESYNYIRDDCKYALPTPATYTNDSIVENLHNDQNEISPKGLQNMPQKYSVLFLAYWNGNGYFSDTIYWHNSSLMPTPAMQQNFVQDLIDR